MSCITLTFCDCSENHVGMEQNGSKSSRGYSSSDLDKACAFFKDKGKQIERINLNDYMNITVDDKNLENMDVIKAAILQKKLGNKQKGIPYSDYAPKYKYNGPRAEILIVRNALDATDSDLVFEEIASLEWDRKYLCPRRKKVLNKHARANLCFSEESQEPDYINKKGRIVGYNEVPKLKELKTMIETSLDETEQIECEGNLYDDVNKNGIGWHGDSERRKVVGVRIGKSMPLCYRWFHLGSPIGTQFTIQLNHGDLYIMSDKAVGNDWKKKLIPTLRHSAGAAKYTMKYNEIQ